MKYILVITLIFSSSLFAASPITPLYPPKNINYDKAKLGEKLFFDARLSVDNTIACASCHKLDEGGDDNLQFSYGVKGRKGVINAPTVLNSSHNFRQYWDGRARNLEEQVLGPIENPVEMGFNMKDLLSKLKKTEYQKLFKKIYPEGITKKSLTQAIAEYEKTLVTLNAPFDKYLKGDTSAISKEAKKGYELFKEKGCINCHHGMNVGGNLYAKFGVMQDSKSESLGRYNVTKRERDRYYFKVPSLRNVEHTAPYFHDGRAKTLQIAIKSVAKLQLGRDLSDKELQNIEAFLKSLSGDLPQMRNIYVP